MDISDKKLKSLLENGRVTPDKETEHRLDALLQELPEQEEAARRRKPAVMKQVMICAAAAAACLLVILPNIDPKIAHAMAEVPVIGELVKVITIRSYFYNDGEHMADIKVPEITENGENGDVSEINEDIKELTDRLIARFQEHIGDGGYGYVGVDYEVVTDTAEWFTLKLMVSEVAGSSDTRIKYYHIDRATGQTVQLSDLFAGSGYVRAISENIREQMLTQMAADDSLVYFLDSPESDEWDFYLIDENQNFYFNENGEMVIVYDKYEVAPGSMGCPEFVVDRSVYEEYLLEK